MGLHLLAVLALTSVFGSKLKGAWGGPSQAVLRVTLVRFPKSPNGVSLHSAAPTATSAPSPPLRAAEAAALPEAADVNAPAAETPPADPMAADTRGEIDGLYRAPFRDAVGQAYASLRGGLGCAHVELDALPADVRTQCEAARRR